LDIKSPIRLNDSIELDLGVDSLAMVELVCAVEKDFNIELDEKVVSSGITTVKDIILTVKELTK
jgi:acyl carrier protein